MAQNITIANASYPAVPAIDVPKTGGGTARFTDTSPTTATADKIFVGYGAFDANGEWMDGTAPSGGGGGSVTQDQDGYIILPPDGGGGGGSANIEALNVTANGTYTATGAVDGYSPVTVNVSGGGGGGDMSDPIRFFDYDGTLVASYKAVPDSLPSVPTHTGLKNGTWNYTLQQVTTQFNAMGSCDVGANYMTESEDTEIDVVMQEGRLDPSLNIAVNGTVTVDWGDNTTADTVTGTSLTTRKVVPHSYASTGAYTIKIHVVSGSFTFFTTSAYLILYKNTTTNENRVYANCIQAVRIGRGITSFTQYAFAYCSSLSSISIPSTVSSMGNNVFYYCPSLVSIPSGVTSIGSSAFGYCYALATVSIPSGVTSIGNSAFSGCYALASLSIPSTVTSIGNSVFSSCYSLASLTIPSGVTSIGNSAFSSCYGMAEYHFKPTTPPTLGTTAFNNIPSDCKIYVPAASLSAYQTANNWSTYASYMVGE